MQNLVLRNDLLYQRVKLTNDYQSTMQFVLPTEYILQSIKACHDGISHLGLKRSLDLLCDQFYWPSMATDMENHIRKCDPCLCFKGKAQRAGMKFVEVSYSLELVHLYFLTIESGKLRMMLTV